MTMTPNDGGHKLVPIGVAISRLGVLAFTGFMFIQTESIAAIGLLVFLFLDRPFKE